MLEVWKEICQGMGIKTFLVTLLSIAIIMILAFMLSFYLSSRQGDKDQKSINIGHLHFKPNQTNFTS